MSAALLLAMPALSAQRTVPRTTAGSGAGTEAGAAGQPRVKGVWEPVNYPADVYMTDVYFVSPDVGWVTSGRHGQGGMLLHTKDGGTNWSVQLGDHESRDGRFWGLHFLDATRGWALQDAGVHKFKLLSTDGENWADAGLIAAEWGLQDYTFTSPTDGVYIDGNDNVSRIMRTSDGGRTWREVFRCETKAEVNGLTRDVKCALKSVHFPSPRVGYAAGGAYGVKRTLFVARTEDGGESWQLMHAQNVGGGKEDTGGGYENSTDQEVFFVDESTGYVTTSGQRLYRTTDGGRTWTGVVATPGPVIRFADPEVGWSFYSYKTLSYTTDGGKRWTTRQLPFPATVTAFSLPRRDRGYAVGEHGMVYRYRVVPVSEATAAKAVAGPVMPPFTTALDAQLETVASQVEALTARVDSAPASSSAADAQFAKACCEQAAAKLVASAEALAASLPQFASRYRNVNLLLVGVAWASELPAQLRELRSSVATLRQAKDRATALAALKQASKAIDNIRTMTATAFPTLSNAGARATRE